MDSKKTFMHDSGEANIRYSQEGKVKLRIAPKVKDLSKSGKETPSDVSRLGINCIVKTMYISIQIDMYMI